MQLRENEKQSKGKLWETIWNVECQTPPIPEDLSVVPGYGNPKAKFQRTHIPEYMNIEKSQIKEDGSILYTPLQQQFIKEEVKKIFYTGQWIYIRGILTWLNPWMYLGLNYWRPAVETQDGFLEYRDRQRKILHVCWNIYQNQKELGVIYLKGRQEGLSTWGHLIMFWLAVRAEKQNIGLSSSDQKLADENFDELIAKPVNSLPIWLIPVHRMNKNEMIFTEPPERQSKTKKTASMSKALGGSIRLRALTKRGWDGKRLNGLFADEGGKWVQVQITKWWSKQIRALMANGRKRGFAFFPTTTEEGDQGGAEFQKFFEQANLDTRQNGKYPTTTNKLVNLFLPAYMGLPGWTDAYGNDISDYPDDEQWDFMQQNGHDERVGAKDKLLRDRQQLLDAGLDDLYAEEMRQNPFNPSDAFNSLNEHCPFDVTILQSLKRIAEGKDIQDRIRTGYFYWLDVKERSIVGWREDPKGPIQRTWEPPAALINNMQTRRGIKSPTNVKLGSFGVDPYLKASTKTKGSKMAITGKLYYNKFYEDQNKKHKETTGQNLPGYFPTPSVFFSFVHRSADSNYDMEQLMMAAVYYSFPIVIENNASISVENFFTARGYGGFLLKEAEILAENSPSQAQFEVIGIHTGGEGQGNDVVRRGATYFNDFLRGDALYLGEHTYDITEEPIRYPFLQNINDNMQFDITDRTKSDATMSTIMVHFYEYNLNDYNNPFLYNEAPTSNAARLFPKGMFMRKMKDNFF
jgi:hypothetical protein